MPATPFELQLLSGFLAERRTALDAQDPMAALLTLATVTADGDPELRTLVLRELDGRLAVFVNATSPKNPALASGSSVAVLCYWPSQKLQYRLQCRAEPVPQHIVHESWRLRPATPRLLDHLYISFAAQSSPIADRQRLLDTLAAADPALANAPPPTALGYYLVPVQVERLLLTDDGTPHDRRLLRADAAPGPLETVLMP